MSRTDDVLRLLGSIDHGGPTLSTMPSAAELAERLRRIDLPAPRTDERADDWWARVRSQREARREEMGRDASGKVVNLQAYRRRLGAGAMLLPCSEARAVYGASLGDEVPLPERIPLKDLYLSLLVDAEHGEIAIELKPDTPYAHYIYGRHPRHLLVIGDPTSDSGNLTREVHFDKTVSAECRFPDEPRVRRMLGQVSILAIKEP